MTRLFFCTDLHGSEVCFRKFLHAGPVYEASTVVMGGDCTGKMIVPVVAENGSFEVAWAGRNSRVDKEHELEEIEAQIRNSGLYPVRLTREEESELTQDPGRMAALFSEVMLGRLKSWLALAEERLSGSGIHVIVTPGNDDEWAIDDVLGSSSFIDAAEGRITRIGGNGDPYEMLSLGWSNPTPWNTPRECSEEDLTTKIDVLARQIQDLSRAIFNIHVPPYGTGLDAAPELDGDMRLKRGGAISKSVGSTAVRDAILEHQPLLSLHGHIHESRGIHRLGRTLCINPGSSYSDWQLQGVIVDLAEGEIERYVPTTG
jgi:Icc-related predicted phosphoesterase